MARFAVSDAGDHSASVWIVTLLTLAYTTLTLCLRLWVKVGMLGVDDGLAAFAQFLAYGSIGSVMYALDKGLAKDLSGSPPREVVGLAQAARASQVLYLLTLAAAKVTTVLFLQRIFERANQHKAIRLCNVAIGLVSIWGVGATIAVSVACEPIYLWEQARGSSCAGAATRWLLVTIFDCGSEIVMLVLAAYLISGLQMRFAEKATVCTAFAWRLGLVVLAPLHYRSCIGMLASSQDTTSLSHVVIWEQVGICYSLLSVTWPFSKQWIKSFNTSTLAVVSAHGSSGPTTAGVSAPTSRTQRSSRLSLTRRSRHDGSGALSSSVYGGSKMRDNRGSGSQEMIIRREDEITVIYEDGGPDSR